MELFIGTIFGFILGAIACWLFWKYLLYLKPNVEISQFIAVSQNQQTGRRIFTFKIVNRGNRQVIDITLNAWISDLIEIPGGQVSRGLHRFPLRKSETLTLAPKGTSDRPWGLTPEATFKSEPDFDVYELLSDETCRILITLRGTDALSGTTIVQQKTYLRRDLKEGLFRVGENIDIV